ncbi:MAG: helix-turn-helix domain-containing protein [Polaromonas sp.]|uniref:helix-turn-helix domain-containing protein n=1 Tax=Polaromonas sp. TaxID=1869339 RepID=UPI0025FD7F75|nr:helix-turn-helix domain-containing protein [Polaromonas sp.]MBI2726220.1 helix-turn-helix domain-containing protein [Polaromonas sp.]
MNIAVALKSEISRVSRKEMRAEFQTLKKVTTKLRADNAELKRRLLELEKAIKLLSKAAGSGRARNSTAKEAGAEKSVERFSAKGIAAQRKRLGLSAADMGKLIGVSGATVYLWEKGQTRPRPTQMTGISAVRQMGRRDARSKLDES